MRINEILDKIRLSMYKQQFMNSPYFKKNGFELHLGDCLDVLKNLPDESVDMIFADPPYHLSNNGFSMHAGKRVSVNKGNWDKSNGTKEDFDFQCTWIAECRRILKPHGTIWISGTYHSIYQCGFALQSLDYHILNEISWYKPNAAPNIGCRSFAASHETLIWARKDKKAKHVFHYKFMKNNAWSKDFIKKPEKQMRSVWAISTSSVSEKKFGKHPTQKPLALLERILQACTNKDDVILDPFTGSSTTGIAAYGLGRKFIGIDKEKEYLELSMKRFSDISIFAEPQTLGVEHAEQLTMANNF